MPNSVQFKNAEKENLDKSKFRQLWDPTHAWGDVASLVLSFPGLVGYWPGAVNRATPVLLDLSGDGLDLQRNNATVAYDPTTTPLVPYIRLTGGVSFSHSDDNRLDITGTDAIIASSIRGLTMGAWVWFDNAASTVETVMAKYSTTGDQRSYSLVRVAAGGAEFRLSSAGTSATTTVATSVSTIGQDGWYFLAGQYDATNTDMWVWLNDEQTVNASAAASIFNSTAFFAIGQESTGTNFMTGRVAFPFLCASYLSDTHLLLFYEMTAPLFGVRP